MQYDPQVEAFLSQVPVNPMNGIILSSLLPLPITIINKDCVYIIYVMITITTSPHKCIPDNITRSLILLFLYFNMPPNHTSMYSPFNHIIKHNNFLIQ